MCSENQFRDEEEIGRRLSDRNSLRGNPDVVLERAGHDALGVSTMLVRPHIGRTIYSEHVGDERY